MLYMLTVDLYICIKYNSTGEYRVSCLLIGLEFHYISLSAAFLYL
jgi:hypothetical protein